jgi:Spy/CpxP family protein refolding chaperone
MEGARRTRLQASALLVVTFVVGGLVGAVSSRAVNARELQTTEEAVRDSSRDGGSHRNNGGRRNSSILLEPGVLDQLSVTAEQRERIEAILAKRDQQNRQLFNSIRPRMDTIMQSTRTELQAQLTAEQRTKLSQIIKERHERWKAQRDRNRSSDGKPRTDSAKQSTEK